MSDTHTEVTHQGWLSRIGASIKGILFGVVVIPLCIILLWWNEGRAVTTANSLKEGAAAVVSVPADKVDPANDKKLIHVTGEARADVDVADPQFGVSLPALRLVRNEEIYQWVESSKSEKKEKFGGGEETVTTYTYEKKWVDEPVSSTKFKQPNGHSNQGDLTGGNESFPARNVMLGAFQVPERFVSRMGDPARQPVTEVDLVRLPAALKADAQVHNGAFFFGQKADSPQVGDTRVSFEIVKPGTFSILAGQTGSTFEPYQTKAGDEISFIEEGAVSAETMFKDANSANKFMTWLARMGGFLFMSFGFIAIMRPLSVLGSVVPFIGSLIGMGTGLIAFLLAAIISLVVIAIAWIVARPILAMVLLVAAVGGLIALRRMASGRPRGAAAAA